MNELRIRLRDERGIAVIVALLISMVVVTLGITSVTLAVHNSEQSTYDRRRVQAIAAAEAGVNWYFSHLQSVPFAEWDCTVTQELPTQPPTQFDAGIILYKVDDSLLACPPAELPATAEIRSEGSSTVNPVPTRTVQSAVELSIEGSGAFAGVTLFSETGLNFPSNIKIFGRTGNDGNIYSNGNITLSGNDSISGTVTAKGTLSILQNAKVNNDVSALGAISMRSSSLVVGNASSGTSITVQQNKLAIHLDATAPTISAPGNAIGGDRNIGTNPFEERTFPPFEYVESAWFGQGYNIRTFTNCGQQTVDAVRSVTEKTVIRIEADCNLALDGVLGPLSNDLAIISDGSLSLGNNTSWANDGFLHNLYLVFGFDGDGATGSGCDITFGNNATIDPGSNVLFHTPCTINMGASTMILEGQVIGGSVLVKSGTTMTYRPILVPGMGGGTPAADIMFIREIVTAD